MITIVIPSADRLSIIKKVINSYRHNFVSEILVINDSIIENYESLNYDEIRVINTSGRIGAPAARNIGVSSAKNNLILFGEDDAFIDKNYVQKLYSEAIHHPQNIYSGILCNLLPAERFYDAEIRIRTLKYISSREYFNYTLFKISTDYQLNEIIQVPLTHALFMYNKSAYPTLKFYENYSKVIGYREETDLQASITALGGKIFVVPDTYVMHMSRLDVTSGGQRTSKIKFLLYSTLDNFKFLLRHKKIYCDNSFFISAYKAIKFPISLIFYRKF